jgi:D-ribose pyranose/furanose isomerase RbsD
MVQRDPLRAVGRFVTEPMESLAQGVAERVVKLVVQALDLNELIGQIDLDRVMDRVDLNRLLDRVDVDALVQRVDIPAVLDRIDLDLLLERVDFNQVIQRVDINVLVQQTELGAVIAKSTSGVAAEVLDAVRSQTVGLDQFVDRLVSRVLRRKGDQRPLRPTALIPIEDGS